MDQMLSVGEEVVRSWPLSLESRSKNFLPSKKTKEHKAMKSRKKNYLNGLRGVKFPEKDMFPFLNRPNPGK